VDPLHDKVATILARAVNRDADVVRAEMAVSTTLDARQARQYGLIDEIVNNIPVKGTLRQ
jgi:ATP-dependent protease ClpP protease subunit